MKKTVEKSKIISMSIKPSILKELDALSAEWGTSRSGIVSVLVKLNAIDSGSAEKTLRELNIKQKHTDWETRAKFDYHEKR